MRIPVSSIVNYQLPSFVRDEYPLFSEFLEQYYLSDQSEKLTQNLDKDIDIDFVFKLRNNAVLTSEAGFIDSDINVDSTEGFPDNYGLIQIDSEIILYTSKSETQFLGCTRGFSGVTKIDREYLEFSESELEKHGIGSTVINLSILYLKEFAYKIKKRITPGFEDRELFEDLNSSNFVKNIKSFYTSKGSDESFRILFGALYGKEVEVIKPRDFLIRPSDAQYRITKDIVVEAIEGDPYDLINETIYQDASDFIEPAQGTVIEVSKIIRNNKDYHVISLDFDYNKDIDTSGTTRSEFSIHPKTVSTSTISSNSTYIDVDSTVGFPERGSLKIDLEDGNSFTVQYNSKVLNQFLECSDITFEIPEKAEIKLDDFIYGIASDGSRITMRVNGILGDIDFVDLNFNYNESEEIKIKTLGEDAEGFKFNNWFFNVPATYKVKTIGLINSGNFSYSIETIDEHSFVIGDTCTLYGSNGEKILGQVFFIDNKNNIKIITFQLLDLTISYDIRKNVSKVNISNEKYQNLNTFNSNIQNIYTDYNRNLYVSSPSLPRYSDPLEIKEFSSLVPVGNYTDLTDITFQVSHKFYTGDLVVYKPSNEGNSITLEGTYYVYVVNSKTIRLAKSQLDLSNLKFVVFNGSISPGNESIIEPKSFYDNNLNRLEINPQNIVTKLEPPSLLESPEETFPGTIGIFINGVELCNYKSTDLVYYGGLEKVDILSTGDGYNLLDPPEIIVSDAVGFGASLVPFLEGSLEKINIVDPGFGFIGTPKIVISGGGGSGAEAVAEMVSFTYFAEFDAVSSVNISEDTISFDLEHKFANGEKVVYKTQNRPTVVGLNTNSEYFVGVVSSTSVKLFNTLNDSLAGINTVNLSAVGSGDHSLVAVNAKKKISNIKVVSPGSGYKNKRLVISGINSASDTLVIKDHGYSSGEIIEYLPEGPVISGLSSSQNYYVTVVDNDNIRLSGIFTLNSSDFNFVNKNYINFTSTLSGVHYVNYPTITVSIIGPSQIPAVVQPVFSGKITSVFVSNPGVDYGSEGILNYHKKPSLFIQEGSNAQVTPVIVNGSINRVIVNSPGSNYNQIPDIEIFPRNNGAILTPIITDGKLTEVIVVNGGEFFDDGTFINIVPKGSGVKFDPIVKSRRIDLVKKLFKTNNISFDDGYITRSIDSLEYTHLYSPRSLRKSVSREFGSTSILDLNLDINNREINNTIHSPIIGWAYDGNPIYGPYGYANSNSGPVKKLSSGYKLKSNSRLINENRPSLAIYPKGFFEDDYFFDNSGDLDEHNGRFCITPEYPNGVYAYFCTVSETPDPNFNNYFSPVYPYIIGPTFRNRSIEKIQSFDDIGEKLLRNTTPYNLLSSNSSYDFVVNPNKIKEENIEITSVGSDFIENVQVLEPGIGYRVNEPIIFNDNSRARISEVSGVSITSIASSYINFNNLEVVSFNNSYIGILTSPHNIDSTKTFNFNSKFELNKKIVAKPYINKLQLRTSVDPTATTGIVTFFDVSGNLNFPLKENDIFTINEEQVKVLNIDFNSSRIKVERNQNGTIGINTHRINSVLEEDSRKFTFNVGLTSSYNLRSNKEYYFDPSESVGLGTTSNYTLNISNPGLGKSIITIPPGSIFIENHNLISGDVVFYNAKTNQPIEVSLTGIGTTSLPENSELFVTKIDNNLIGLSTVGSGTSNFYFESVGTGLTHSLTVNYPNRLIGEIFYSNATVSTATSSLLAMGDEVFVNVSSGVQTSISFYYNDFNRRICGDKKNISSLDLISNTIYCENHNFKLSEKIIYVSTSPIGGLSSNQIYFAIPITKDTFKVSSSLYGSSLPIPQEIDLTSSGTGYFYSINPRIEVIPNQDVVFNVSDESLSFTRQGTTYPAFELKLFYDESRLNKFTTFDLVQSGLVGITSTAKYTLKTKNLPERLYYAFSPVNLELNNDLKKEIYIDNSQVQGYEIIKVSSHYSGRHVVSGVGTNSFSYELDSLPEINLYLSGQSDLTYSTSSKNTTGPIKSVRLIDVVKTKTLPEVETIRSTSGQGAILTPISSKIGAIQKVKKLDIGFDYNVDYTIRPKINAPKIAKVEVFYQLDSIDVISKGVNYTFNPNIILIDSNTRKKYDVDLIYRPEENRVIILKNTTKIKDRNLEIISTNNDNGFEIDTLSYNSTTRIVTVELKTPFNNVSEYPFSVGEYVYIENTLVEPSLRGYNSSAYGYSSFEILESTPNIGGIGATFTYSLEDYLNVGENPGTIDSFYTSGFAIAEKYVPKFSIKTVPNHFFEGEDFESNKGATGKIISWSPDNNTVRVSTTGEIKANDLIFGRNSGAYLKVLDVYSASGYIDISSNSIVEKGWKGKTGFLNDSLQRIHDNNYYQYFSYDLKSEIDYSNWSDLVDSLNHTAGFKKFGTLLVNTTNENVGINTDQNLGDFEVINDLYSVLDVNCVSDFDLVTENYFSVDNDLRSNEIYFNSRRLQDYIESIGNKVLLIDDIANKFAPVTPIQNSVVDSFKLNAIRFKKYVVQVTDKLEPENTHSQLINLLHNDFQVSINQFSVIETIDELGYFDAEIDSFDVNLLFYPFETSNKIYSVNSFSFNISDSDTNIGNIQLGDTVDINSNFSTGIGTTTVCSISTDRSAAKVLLVFSDKQNGIFYSDEVNYVHDGTTIVYNSYGELNMGNTVGIGTYNLYYSGGNINIDLAPFEQNNFVVNSIVVEFDKTATTVDSLFLSGNLLESTYVGVATTGTPAKSLIYSHNTDYTSGLHHLVITDTDNNIINSVEILGILNITNQEVYSVKFGELITKNEIGEIDVEYSNVDGSFEIYFTPNNDINYEVRIFSTLISKFRRSETVEL
jgi:hypothetical protein